MEEYYGVKLFDRISRKLYLTENGRRALQYARHIIDLLDEMEQGVRDVDAMGTAQGGDQHYHRDLSAARISRD